MASIPGSVPLSGKVAPTDTTDTFATHVDIYGEGGYMTVADITERNAITTERRKQGMAVFVNSSNEFYILQGGTANTNWTLFSGGSGTGDMQDIYDNSTPDVTASDTSKGLELLNGEVTIATSSASGLSATMDLSGEEGVQISSSANNVNIDAGYDIQLSAGIAAANNCSLDMTQAGLIQIQSDGPGVVIGGTGLTSVVALSGQGEVSLQSAVSDVTLDAIIGDIRVSSQGLGTALPGDILGVKGTQPADTANGKLEWRPGVQSVKATLTPAQILNLHTTSIELIPAPGAGKFIQILSLYSFLEFQTIAYTTQTSGSGASAKSSAIMTKMGTSIPSSQFTADQENLVPFLPLGQSTDYRGAMNAFPRYDASIPTVNTWGENESLIAFSHLANTNGDSPIHVYVSYMITDL